VKTLIDFGGSPVFALAGIDGLGRKVIHEGMLIEGPQGWGEFSPAPDCDHRTLVRWLTAAIEPGTVGWADPLRGRIPVSVAVPATDAARAHGIAAAAGCRTADVTVAAHPASLGDDLARVEAVRDALGADGVIRVNAGGRWDVDAAAAAITRLDRAARGIQFVEQPCRTAGEVAAVRCRVDVPVAIRALPGHTDDLRAMNVAGSADLAVLYCGPLGGVRRSLRVAEACGVPCVVSSPSQTSIGLAAGVALAGALPDLPFASSLGTLSLLGGDVVTAARSLVAAGGYLPVAPAPPAPDGDHLAECLLTDPVRRDRWRERLRVAAGAV
jgi:o-succinylbenzoate synthase